MQTAKVILAPFWLIAAAFVGLADTSYLSLNYLHGTLPACNILRGCDIVLESPYAKVLAVPLAYVGFVFYIYLLALAVLLAVDPYSRGLRLGALAYALVGLACSCAFVYIQGALIGAWCMYCLISALTTLVIFALALWHFRATRAA